MRGEDVAADLQVCRAQSADLEVCRHDNHLQRMTTPCGRFSTLPAASAAWAVSFSSPGLTSATITSHSAKLGVSALASWPLTRTFFTVPLSAVVPRTATLPPVSLWT